jgi:hypothetical protein
MEEMQRIVRNNSCHGDRRSSASCARGIPFILNIIAARGRSHIEEIWEIAEVRAMPGAIAENRCDWAPGWSEINSPRY